VVEERRSFLLASLSFFLLATLLVLRGPAKQHWRHSIIETFPAQWPTFLCCSTDRGSSSSSSSSQIALDPNLEL
jgi:hypothetical protein